MTDAHEIDNLPLAHHLLACGHTLVGSVPHPNYPTRLRFLIRGEIAPDVARFTEAHVILAMALGRHRRALKKAAARV